MAETLSEQDWGLLLDRIDNRKCTPFLGAGASYGFIPLGGTIAENWAAKEDYPLDDKSDLPRVSQYLATKLEDNVAPKERLLKEFESLKKVPDFKDPDEPFSILAALPFTTYITTNYDPFMFQALERQPDKTPKRDLCRWNTYVRDNHDSVFETDPDYVPDVGRPIVYYLHGHHEMAESIVLTEDDYLDFLVTLSRDPDLLPGEVQAALGGSSLLFLGYSLRDLNFRVFPQYRALCGESARPQAHLRPARSFAR